MLCILVRFSPLFPTPSRFSLPTQLHFFFLSQQSKQTKIKSENQSKQMKPTHIKKLPKQNKSKKEKHGVSFVFQVLLGMGSVTECD